MARQPRLILPDVAIHVVQRGNNRLDCFRATTDYQVYLAQLRSLAADLDCAIHAYCLMTNHVHLLMTPSSAEACISVMRNLGQRYVQYFNRRHHRTGTLWEGRYHSCVAESARYVLACYRYIELNPVRAGMVGRAIDYSWSSHAANIGAHADELVSPHAEYLALGSDTDARRLAYDSLFDDELEPQLVRAIRDATSGGFPLASESFKNMVQDSTGRITERRRARRKTGADSGELIEPNP